ncbi:MAG: phosphate-starvation-inducible PsiE family protein [Bacteriovoracaceae bacterium]|nr:phosphate-starvation-inducible PsiE family protein [Bacteriovoracaceae bacterium]
MDFDEDTLTEKRADPEKDLLFFLDKAIKGSLRVLAILMTVVIFLGVIDVFYILYNKLMSPPKYLLEISDIFATFSGFMAVLIAIEVYANIIIYLKENLIHVRIVMATALMAIARKVIVLDFSVLDPNYLIGIGVVMLSSGVVYWLTYKIPRFKVKESKKD